jgi:hypothetical protein
MKRTLPMFSLLILAACGDSGKKQAADVEAAARVQAAEDAYAKTPDGEVWVKHRDWSRETCALIARHRILTGMTAEQVRAAWGEPFKITSTTVGSSTDEKWVLVEHGTTYIYFKNGIMTNLQRPESGW